jgi:hypothetical protein
MVVGDDTTDFGRNDHAANSRLETAVVIRIFMMSAFDDG